MEPLHNTIDIKQRRNIYQKNLLSLFPSKWKSITSSQNVQLFDSNGQLLLHFYRPNDSQSPKLNSGFTSFMDSLNDNLFIAKNKPNRRYAWFVFWNFISFRFTNFTKVGSTGVNILHHKYNPRIHQKNGLEKGKTYFVEYSELKPKNKIKELHSVFDFISANFKKCHLDEWEKIHQIAQFNGKFQTPWYFHSGTLNKHPCRTTIHADEDALISTLYYGGHFKNGAFPQ